ncbi:hypothetical protein L596_027218 [Steinernema carpocapsae]|uniref:Rho-GAP domain-containing protein n=1 Tax=Steinernema carpocapsae TaxID=34508 RepID=A0A4U5M3Q5_STECR|nr:hypothetical protein L596_027218 [Steinernema carpocapsae]
MKGFDFSTRSDPTETLENGSFCSPSSNNYAWFLNGGGGSSGASIQTPFGTPASSQFSPFSSPATSPMPPMRRRRYVKEGACQLTSLSTLVQHNRYMFLFNDLLLIAKQKGENSYKLKEKIPLEKLWVSSHNCAHSFLIGWPINNYVVYFRTEQEKSEWFEKLNECQKRKQLNKSTTVTVEVKIAGRQQKIRKTVTNTIRANELIGELIRDLDLPPKDSYALSFETGAAGLMPLHGIECVYSILMDHVAKSNVLLSEDQLAHLDTCKLVQCRLVLRNTVVSRPTPTAAAAIVAAANQFKRVLTRTESRRLFGKELEGSMPPQPVLTMIDHLMLHGTDIEGIFRKSPKQATVRALRQQLEQGQVPDFHQFNIHVIASLLKEYLRSIPGHLLLSGNHHLWVEMSNDSCSQKRLKSCSNLLQLLPPSHTVLLKKILKLLRRIAKNEDSSKMNSRSLAVCIAPSLIDNPDVIEAVTRIPEIVVFLIEHACELFPGLEQEEEDESPAMASRRLHLSTDSGFSADVDVPSTSPDSALFDSPMSECSIDFDGSDKTNANEPQPTSEICIVELTGTEMEDNDKTPVVSRENSNVKSRYANNYQWRSHLSRQDSSPPLSPQAPLSPNTSMDSTDSNVRFVRIEPCDSQANSNLTSPALSQRNPHGGHSYLDDLRVSDIIISHKKKGSTDSTKTLTSANTHGSRQLGSIRSPEMLRNGQNGPGLPRTPLQHYASVDRATNNANRFPTYQEIVKFRETTTSSLDRTRTTRVSDYGMTSPISQRANRGTLERSKTVEKPPCRPAYSTPYSTQAVITAHRPHSEIADRWSEERKALSRANNDNNNNSMNHHTPLRPRTTHMPGADPGLNMDPLEINWSVPHLRSIFQERDTKPTSIDTLYATITPKVLT